MDERNDGSGRYAYCSQSSRAQCTGSSTISPAPVSSTYGLSESISDESYFSPYSATICGVLKPGSQLGQRNPSGSAPRPRSVASARSKSARSSSSVSANGDLCAYEWCPTSWPAARTASTTCGWRSAVQPGTKNVAGSEYSASSPRILGTPTSGPYAWCDMTP